jgi:hypothetical protein
MIRYIMMTGLVVVGLSNANANDRLVWPQSDAFYKGQVEQKYRTIEQPTSSVPQNLPVTPPAGYVAPQGAYSPAPAYYGQPYAAPAMPYGYYPNSNNAGMPFGMNNLNNMNNFVPPMPHSFSVTNPANGMNGMGFPGFPSFGNNAFNPFNFGR